MKNLMFSISIALCAFLVSNCAKPVYGCTDPNATNYNSKATNQGAATCEYQGQVVFYQISDQGYIGVAISDKTATVTKYYTSGLPACGADGCATFTLPIGTYNYTAVNKAGREWTGKVTITSNDCHKLLLN